MRKLTELSSEMTKELSVRSKEFVESVNKIRVEWETTPLFRAYHYPELEKMIGGLALGSMGMPAFSEKYSEAFVERGHNLFKSISTKIPPDTALKQCEKAYAEIANLLIKIYELKQPYYLFHSALSSMSSSSSSGSSMSSSSSSAAADTRSSTILSERPSRGLYDLDILIFSFAATYFAVSILPTDDFLSTSLEKINLIKMSIEEVGQQLMYRKILIEDEQYSQAGIQADIKALVELKELLSKAIIIPEFLSPKKKNIRENAQAFLDDLDTYIASVEKMDLSHLPKFLTSREMLSTNDYRLKASFHNKLREIIDLHHSVVSGTLLYGVVGRGNWQGIAAVKAVEESKKRPIEKLLDKEIESLKLENSFFDKVFAYAEEKEFSLLLDLINQNLTKIKSGELNNSDWFKLFSKLLKELDGLIHLTETQQNSILAIIKEILAVYPAILVENLSYSAELHHKLKLYSDSMDLFPEKIFNYLYPLVEKALEQSKESKICYTAENFASFFDAAPLRKKATLSEICQLATDLNITQLLEATGNPQNKPLLTDPKSAAELFLKLTATFEIKNIVKLKDEEAEICAVLNKLFASCPELKNKERIQPAIDKVEILQKHSEKQNLEKQEEDASWGVELDKELDEAWDEEADEGEKSQPVEQEKILADLHFVLSSSLSSALTAST